MFGIFKSKKEPVIMHPLLLEMDKELVKPYWHHDQNGSTLVIDSDVTFEQLHLFITDAPCLMDGQSTALLILSRKIKELETEINILKGNKNV